MMRFRQQLWRGALALFCATGAVRAQTSEELQGRYGPPLRAESTRRPALWVGYGVPLSETYVVRPDISLTVTYTADGEACRAEIHPYSSAPAIFPPPEAVSADEVSEIIAGLTTPGAPTEGGELSSITFNASCSAVSVAQSARFEIRRTMRAEKCGGGVSSATVVWRGAGRLCAPPAGARPAPPRAFSCWATPAPPEAERRWR